VRDRQCIDIDILETAHVDRGHRGAVRVDALAERVNPAALAEAVLDHVLVEHVGGEMFVGREERHVVARHEPHQRALAPADRAVARHHALQVAFRLELHVAAVTASAIKHVRLPVRPVRIDGAPAEHRWPGRSKRVQ